MVFKYRLRMRSVDLAKRIKNLVVDNSIFDNLHYGPGWMWDEGSWWHAPQISAMSFNENCIDFNVSPGKLKRPNDLLIKNKKVCGILQELIKFEKKIFLIIGIGINTVYSPKNKLYNYSK